MKKLNPGRKWDFRDPLYGFITVNEVEKEIIDTAAFQRLRKIMQLGTTYLVYPSGTHSRFEHSLGVLEASQIMLRQLLEDPKSRGVLHWGKNEAEELQTIFRLAALLHDVGHSPFSHASEDLFLNGKNHEFYTYEIIVNSEIGKIIEKHFGKEIKLRIADIAIGKAKKKNDAFLSKLLTGEIGTDRIDYLIRDSYHLGVAYGKFDYHRLIRSLHVYSRSTKEKEKGPDLAVYDGGIHAVEGLLLARYFMFLQVYFHKTRRILDIHLKEFLERYLPNGHYPASLDKFLRWDDTTVLKMLSDKSSSALSKRLIGRNHFRRCHQTSDHPDKSEMERFDWLTRDVEKKYGSKIRIDDAENNPHNYIAPSIFVFWNMQYKPIADRSTLIKSLNRINKMRIYSDPKARKQVQGFCEKFERHRAESRR